MPITNFPDPGNRKDGMVIKTDSHKPVCRNVAGLL